MILQRTVDDDHVADPEPETNLARTKIPVTLQSKIPTITKMKIDQLVEAEVGTEDVDAAAETEEVEAAVTVVEVDTEAEEAIEAEAAETEEVEAAVNEVVVAEEADVDEDPIEDVVKMTKVNDQTNLKNNNNRKSKFENA